MKKLLLSLILAGALGTAAFASASALPIQNTTIQGVTSAVVNCQTTPVHVRWIVSTVSSPGNVIHVQITGISSSCVGGRMGGTVLAGSATQSLIETAISGSTVTFVLSPAIDPALITGIKLYISKG